MTGVNLRKFETVEPGFINPEDPNGQVSRLPQRSQSSFFKKGVRNNRRTRTIADVPTREIDTDVLPTLPESKAKQKPESPVRAQSDMRAPVLAARHRLKLFEVKNILEEFDNMAKLVREEDARVSKADFSGFLCRVFEVPSIPDETVEKAYEASKGPDGLTISVEHFMHWYTINMFTVVNMLNGDRTATITNELIYSLAKKHGVSTMVIDKVKAKFDLYDADGSGEIDLDEFRYLLTVLLKVKSESDLSQDRVMRAWKEIDVDHSGGVDFSEFTQWYLKYLGPCDEEDTRGPAETFYDSFSPQVQRRQVLNTMHSTLFEEEWSEW